MKPFILTKNTVLSFILFFISPILSLPAIVCGVIKKNSRILLLLALFMGVLSYLYIPLETNDKSRYISLYFYFRSHTSFASFFQYLLDSGRPDFLYHFVIYFFARLHISVGYVFFFCTSITFINIFITYCRYFRSQLFSNKVFIGGIILLMFSLSLPSIFSGVRFMLASSFFFRGVFGSDKKIEQYFCYILSILIHFSFLYLVLSVILFFFFQKTKNAKYIFLLSFVFILIPSSVYDYLFSAVNVLGEAFKDKSQQYLYGEDFLMRGLEHSSFIAKFKFYYANAWIFFAYIYILITSNRKSQIRTFLYLLFALINVFYGSPTVFERYMTFARLCIILLIIEEFYYFKNYKLYMSFLVVFIGSFIMDLVILRNNLIASYLSEGPFFLYSIMVKDMGYIQNIQL